MNRVGFFQSIRLKIIIVLILFLLLAIQVVGAYFVNKLEDNLNKNFESNFEERVQILVTNLEEVLTKDRTGDEDGPTLQDEVKDIINRYSADIFTDLQVVDTQLRVIGADGRLERIGKRVTGDSNISVALQFDQQEEELFRNQYNNDRTLRRTVPIVDSETGNPVGVLQVDASIEEIYTLLENVTQIFLNATMLAIVVSIVLGFLVARSITKPITEMRKQAMIMARGDFSKKVNVYGADEIGQLAITFNNMNDRLKLANQTTEEERRKLSSVLSNMSDGVIATDENGAITLINGPASNMIGIAPEEAKGQMIVEVLQMEDKVIDVKELEETGSLTIDFSTDEELFLVKANFSIVQDEEETFTGLITVISDVTEQEKVERERREFVSNVSHELRTPLTTMKSYIEALNEGAWEDKELAPHFLNVTQNETDRMIRLVNDLLQLSKMDHKDKTMNKEQTDLVPLVHHILDRFDMNKTELIDIERKVPDEKIEVWIDTDKITQVIDNIMSNAIKYSPEGGKITFQLIRERKRIKISIQDQGLGIAREKVDKIFERFYRVDKARSRELGGTGLGLAISKEIIEAHHGHIWANSKEGQGTTIYFTLPLMNLKRGGRR
ncbi:two-component system, OmpR family, sensor histidine kinase VicK [Gracilibacillus ureilyticus]|uniref:histidine kinase n=1 Tax=Gracilibacillus ureilyticus TaxID=531814 RepID=A0A1H9UYI6_9BACI|nr:cell wall metabolism sensor histidine kinase WalK [Gracilibacillus ureilyticus]SES14419.1 two-component system, OmpR family, sensor histidine kinase VicK [Gracilibacillus ureilyticus]